jgi:hypothetical protein
VDANHYFSSKKIEEVQNMMKGNAERQPSKNRQTIHLDLPYQISLM